jgi:phage major head subunit gpT-like protein
MAISRSDIRSLLEPNLRAVFGMAPMYPAQWSEIFDVYSSEKAVETEVEMKFTGLAQMRPEGSPTAMDSMGQRIVSSYYHRYFSLGFQITRAALVDDLYKTRFPMMAKSLKHSLDQTKEIVGANVINNGFNDDYPLGDGQPLFSVEHPIDNGVVANMPEVAVDLSEAALEAAIISIQQFKDQAGLTIMTQAKKLLVPPAGQFTADRLLNSVYRTGTANNDINAIYNTKAIPAGYRVNQFFTHPNSWVILTDAPDGAKHYVREKPQTSVDTDFLTDGLLAKAVERYSFGVSNFRCMYGSLGV